MERVNPASLKTSTEGRALIQYFEDCNLTAHLCPANIPSIGYGNTSSVTQADVDARKRITQAEADRLLAGDLAECERLISRHVRVPVAQHEFDALVSILYNVGPGRIEGSNGPDDKGRDGIITLKSGKPSSLLEALNRGDYTLTREWFTAWRSRGTAYERGLLRRRIAEALMFEGLPWKRGAADDFVTKVTTLQAARERALEELADIKALQPPPRVAPNMSEIVARGNQAPAVVVSKPMPSEPARVSVPVVEAVKPEAPAPVSPAPPPPPVPKPEPAPAPPVKAEAPKPEKPKEEPKPKAPVPAPALPKDAAPTNLTDPKDMVLSRRFWGLLMAGVGTSNFLPEAAQDWMLNEGNRELLSWLAVVAAGVILYQIGKRKATRPLK